ncbi:hypothetical protein MFRU_002g01910 [Monilinia fructicola]|nr:hypothetical protein MFRU_002g01910 [Monilinia fructicola]
MAAVLFALPLHSFGVLPPPPDPKPPKLTSEKLRIPPFQKQPITRVEPVIELAIELPPYRYQGTSVPTYRSQYPSTHTPTYTGGTYQYLSNPDTNINSVGIPTPTPKPAYS